MQWVINTYGRQPFLLLVACLLSLRARDRMVQKIIPALFERVRTPQDMCALSLQETEKIIRSIGFYVRKAQQLHDVAQALLDSFDGRVPQTMDEMLSIKGIGRKTANLVLWYAYGIAGIAVDVHVHRISNRLGLVHTKTPEQTEQALMQCLPKKLWPEVNRLFVLWGQRVCLPRKPLCDSCPLLRDCEHVTHVSARSTCAPVRRTTVPAPVRRHRGNAR